MSLLDRLLAAPANVKRGLILASAAALVSSTMVVYTAISATDINPAGAGDESIYPAVNTYVADSDVTIDNNDIDKALSTQSAAGATIPGVEAASPTAAVRTVLTVNNYVYKFDVLESGSAAWGASEDFRIRVWGYNATSTVDLLATLYTQQATPTGDVEGVTVTVDLGSATSTYDAYDILVDRQAETP